MARKKKAVKKKAVGKFPSYRELSLDMLTQAGACMHARVAFVKAFNTTLGVLIHENTVDNLTDDQIEVLGTPEAYFILNEEGQEKLRRSLAAQGVNDWDPDYDNARAYLRTLAKFYVRYPRAFRGRA